MTGFLRDPSPRSGPPRRPKGRAGLARLQQQRQDFNTPVVTFRTDDLEQLAAAYKTTPEMLRRSLHEWGVFRPGPPAVKGPAERAPGAR